MPLLLVGNFSDFMSQIVSRLRLKPQPLMGRPASHELVGIWSASDCLFSGDDWARSPCNTAAGVHRGDGFVYLFSYHGSTGGPGRR